MVLNLYGGKMKERIVIDNKAFLNKTDFVCIEDIVKDLKVEYKIEKYPTNWAELKSLCRNIKGNKKDLGGAMWFEFPIPKDSKLWLGKFLCIDEKGQIGIAEKTFGDDISITIFAESLTPERQYRIIKNLIGEE